MRGSGEQRRSERRHETVAAQVSDLSRTSRIRRRSLARSLVEDMIVPVAGIAVVLRRTVIGDLNP